MIVSSSATRIRIARIVDFVPMGACCSAGYEKLFGPRQARRDGEVVLAIADDGAGVDGDPVSGTGLSIVRALVRDELGGTLSLESNGGLRAEVVFPA